jgi:type II secretory pathway pseudopilin PulG
MTLNQTLKSSTGFTLIEVIVAGALLAGVSLAAVKIFSEQKMAQRRVELDRILDNHISSLKSILNVKANCDATLQTGNVVNCSPGYGPEFVGPCSKAKNNFGVMNSAKSDFPTTITSLRMRKNNINRATNFEKIPLFEQPKHTTLTVFSKKTKPDFEALSCIRFDGQPQLLVMGSGSTENRKKALLYNPADHQVHVLFDTSDYDFLEHCLALTGGADLNIEAVCSDQNNLYIFQRGNINRFHGVLVFDEGDNPELCQIKSDPSPTNIYRRIKNLTLKGLIESRIQDVINGDNPF